MFLLPSFIDASLDRSEVVNWIAPPVKARPFGIVALPPSFPRSADWKSLGAIMASSQDIDGLVEGLRAGRRDAVVVFANRYDGIDLTTKVRGSPLEYSGPVVEPWRCPTQAGHD